MPTPHSKQVITVAKIPATDGTHSWIASTVCDCCGDTIDATAPNQWDAIRKVCELIAIPFKPSHYHIVEA